MGIRLRDVVVAAVTAAMVTVLWLAAAPTAGQAPPGGQFPPYDPPRMADGHPDLNGLWQVLVTANWNLEDHEARPGLYPELIGAYGGEPAGQTVVVGGEIPYQSWALERRQENFQNRAKVDVSDTANFHAFGDPELKCYQPGVPRVTYMPFPFRIVQGSSPYLLFAYEFANTTRVIRMNWEGEAPAPFWMGWSRGGWDGDTLVIDVTGLRAESWFDRAGNFHSEALHVVERYTPLSPYHLMYEATIEDPNVYTQPWTIRFPLYRRMEENVQRLEFNCVPFTEELLYGPYRKSEE